jgi:hypothetical protein
MPTAATIEATWPVFMTKLKNRREVAERTMAFQLISQPAGPSKRASSLTSPCRIPLKPTRRATHAVSRFRARRRKIF